MKLSLNVGLTWPEVEHLYSVGYKGWTVGKVWSAMNPQTDAMSWEWHLCIPMSLPDDAQGVARSKSEALQALADSLHGIILRTSPDRLQRAFLLAEASGLTFEDGTTMEFDVGELTASEAAAVPPALVLPPARPLAVAARHPVVQSAGEQVGQPAALVVERKRMPVIKVRMMPRNQGAVQIQKAPSTVQGQPNSPLETDQG
jgi:hypothetical protein